MKIKKYDIILACARELFWKHGFRRISVEEICARAGVSKMTFYRLFPNKFELAKTVFDNETDKGRKKFHEIMEEDIPVAEKMRKIVMMKFEGTNDISKEFLQDFYLGSEPGLKAYVEEKTRSEWQMMKQDFVDAQNKGIFRKDFNPEFMLHIAFRFIEMMEDKKLLSLYSNPKDFIMEFANFFVYGIAPRDELK